jgi:hypothetical protein
MMIRPTAIAIVAVALARPAFGHHGGGTFDSSREVQYQGVLTRVDFVNPHSWIYFDVTERDGTVSHHRCELRAAQVLRRSGWTPEMFKPGQRITIEGSPDKIDPNSCYLNTVILQDGSRADRYGQFEKAPLPVSNRAPRLPSGQLNISGDWAPEQLVMTDPRGRRGALVPLSTAKQYQPGEGRITLPNSGRGGPQRFGSTELTDAGARAVAAFDLFSVKDNPRLRCETTSIIFDWTFDGPVNRITQHAHEIVLQYGQLGFVRTVHMNEASHPATLQPSLGGHSIGRWEGDVLIVDTVGFRPGMLSPPVPSSDKLHIVERFSLDSKTMMLTRSYTAEDPVYLKGTYAGSDVVQVADIPFGPSPCHELGRLDYSKEGERGVKAAMQKR